MNDENYKNLNTVEDCIKNGGYEVATALPDVSKMPEHLRDHTLAQAELVYIAEAVNRLPDGEIWEPDFTGKVWHYEPLHGVNTTNEAGETIPSGVGFSRSNYDNWRSSSNVGARLSYRDRARCEYAMEKFEAVFIRAKLIIKK